MGRKAQSGFHNVDENIAAVALDHSWQYGKGDRESGQDGKGGKKPRESVERRAVGGRRKVR
jgi:hypothetical protein